MVISDYWFNSRRNI